MSGEFFQALDSKLTNAGVDRGKKQFGEKGVPPFYYNGKLYFYADSRGLYHSMDDKSLTRRLLADGYYDVDDDGKKKAQRYVTLVQNEHAVRYAGPLAGFANKLYDLDDGRRILITESATPVEPQAGQWPLIASILEGMFAAGDADQRPYLYGWLQTFALSYRECLAEGFRATLIPGQAMVLAGPRECGKTLLKLLLIEMFGKRTASPHSYMLGRTDFNAELAEAPILEIDDQAATMDPRHRNQFGSRIKELTVAGVLRVNPKYQTPITLTPCQRLIICVNDEPAALSVLPTLEPSIEDKLMLLKVHARPMPMPTGTIEERRTFWSALVAELPAFMHFLLNEFQISENLVSGRFGVKHYHDGELVSSLVEMSPEARVVEMIDQLFSIDAFSVKADYDEAERRNLGETDEMCGLRTYRPRTQPWTGVASEFEEIIRTRFRRWETDRLFKYGNSAGSLLRTLSMKYPAQVERGRIVRGHTRWIINPPKANDECKPDIETGMGGLEPTQGREVNIQELLQKAASLTEEL